MTGRCARRRLVLPLILVLLLALAPAAWAASPAPAQGRDGMVVTAQHLATDVGVEVLRQGGNAVDAAVAVGYALAVALPAAGNLGGGGFMTIRLKDGSAHFLDFREKAPGRATPGMFLDASGKVIPGASDESWLAVGVPGSPAGLEAARVRFGTMSRAALMAPAIDLAEQGFALEPGDLAIIGTALDRLKDDPTAAGLFMPGGRPLQPGDRLRQPDLARSLRLISDEGPDQAFYHGPLGAAVANAVEAGGGIMTPADLAAYKVRWLEPVTCDYRGYRVISSPPPSSGGVALCEILNILSGYDLSTLGYRSAAEVHFLIEAMRRAYVDRNNRLGDPDFVDNPVAMLLDPLYAAKQRASIDPLRATPSAELHPPAAATGGPAAPAHEGQNTTHFSIIDKDGNAVSTTYTLNSWFGIGRIAGDTGIFMNNEMDDFTAQPGVPNTYGLVQGPANAVAPGKTPLSSMAPTIVVRDDRPVMVIGSPGGGRIITITLLAILNMIDHGMTVQEAIDAPRLHEQWLPDTVYLEPFALSPDTRQILERRGHHFTSGAPWGSAEGILVGGPKLATDEPARSDANSLPLGRLPQDAVRYFGANDSRSPAGKAAGY